MQPLEYHDAPIPGDVHTDKSMQLYKSNMIQQFFVWCSQVGSIIYDDDTVMYVVCCFRATKNDRETGIQEEKKYKYFVWDIRWEEHYEHKIHT